MCKTSRRVENLLQEKKTAKENYEQLRRNSLKEIAKINKKRNKEKFSQRDLENNLSKLENVNQEKAELKRKFNSLRKSHEILEIEWTNLEDDHRAVNNERERLETEMTNKSVHNVDLSKQLQEMEEERDTLDEENVELRKELESFRKDNNEMWSKENERLSEMIESGDKLIGGITGKLEELEGRMFILTGNTNHRELRCKEESKEMLKVKEAEVEKGQLKLKQQKCEERRKGEGETMRQMKLFPRFPRFLSE